MTRFFSVARGVAWRSIHNTVVSPAILVPSIIFPLFFLVAFAGGLSRISDVPNFHYSPGYTSFQFVFVFLQSAAFGGVFTGFGIARDFDSGFARRLLLAAPRRSGIIAGYTIGALLRWAITGVHPQRCLRLAEWARQRGDVAADHEGHLHVPGGSDQLHQIPKFAAAAAGE